MSQDLKPEHRVPIPSLQQLNVSCVLKEKTGQHQILGTSDKHIVISTGAQQTQTSTAATTPQKPPSTLSQPPTGQKRKHQGQQQESDVQQPKRQRPDNRETASAVSALLALQGGDVGVGSSHHPQTGVMTPTSQQQVVSSSTMAASPSVAKHKRKPSEILDFSGGSSEEDVIMIDDNPEEQKQTQQDEDAKKKKNFPKTTIPPQVTTELPSGDSSTPFIVSEQREQEAANIDVEEPPKNIDDIIHDLELSDTNDSSFEAPPSHEEMLDLINEGIDNAIQKTPSREKEEEETPNEDIETSAMGFLESLHQRNLKQEQLEIKHESHTTPEKEQEAEEEETEIEQVFYKPGQTTIPPPPNVTPDRQTPGTSQQHIRVEQPPAAQTPERKPDVQRRIQDPYVIPRDKILPNMPIFGSEATDCNQDEVIQFRPSPETYEKLKKISHFTVKDKIVFLENKNIYTLKPYNDIVPWSVTKPSYYLCKEKDDTCTYVVYKNHETGVELKMRNICGKKSKSLSEHVNHLQGIHGTVLHNPCQLCGKLYEKAKSTGDHQKKDKDKTARDCMMEHFPWTPTDHLLTSLEQTKKGMISNEDAENMALARNLYRFCSLCLNAEQPQVNVFKVTEDYYRHLAEKHSNVCPLLYACFFCNKIAMTKKAKKTCEKNCCGEWALYCRPCGKHYRVMEDSQQQAALENQTTADVKFTSKKAEEERFFHFMEKHPKEMHRLQKSKENMNTLMMCEVCNKFKGEEKMIGKTEEARAYKMAHYKRDHPNYPLPFDFEEQKASFRKTNPGKSKRKNEKKEDYGDDSDSSAMPDADDE